MMREPGSGPAKCLSERRCRAALPLKTHFQTVAIPAASMIVTNYSGAESLQNHRTARPLFTSQDFCGVPKTTLRFVMGQSEKHGRRANGTMWMFGMVVGPVTSVAASTPTASGSTPFRKILYWSIHQASVQRFATHGIAWERSQM